MMTDLHYFDKQKLYHSAAYLSGTIDLDSWREQPYKFNMPTRELFIRALHGDLNSRQKEACKGYQAYLESNPYYGWHRITAYRFAEWRLSAFGKA